MLSDPSVWLVTLKSLLIQSRRVCLVNVLNYYFPSGSLTPIAKVAVSGNLLIIGVKLCVEASFQFFIVYWAPLILSLKNEIFPVADH